MVAVKTLQDLVNERLAALGDGRRPLSQRDAAARSNGQVSHEIIGQLSRGSHSGKLTDRVVAGLALALDVPRSDILRAMDRQRYVGQTPFVAPDRWQRLTHSQRKVVLAVGDALLSAYEEGRDDTREEPAAPVRPLRAARKGRPEHL